MSGVPQEDLRASEAYRAAYRDGIDAVIRRREAEADRARAEYFDPARLAQHRGRYVSDLVETLGWPLTAYDPAAEPPEVTVREEKPYLDGVVMKRLQIEVLPGLPLYGLLFLPEGGRRRPLVIAQHGGGGTPELAAGIHGENHYDGVIASLLEEDFVVFAPQLLLWGEGEGGTPGLPGYGMTHGRYSKDNLLRYLGGGIAALEIDALRRALDALCRLPEVDAARVGMIGLSYGGFYTQMLSAVDERVRAASSNAFFNDRYAYCWGDFAWKGAGLRMKDAEICALIAPRALCVHVGTADPVFNIDTARPELDRLKSFYAAAGAADRLQVIVSGAAHRLTPQKQEIAFLKRWL